ncbi:MAG: hypothetical protein ACOYNO_05375 [Saprospiraceae bacterium]
MEENLLTGAVHPVALHESASTQGEYSGAAQTWLHATPAPPDVCDLFALNDEQDFAVRCIKMITENRPFALPVQTEHYSMRWFNHFYFEARNREKVFGTRNLGIGYPFVMGRIGTQDVQAPLWVYQIALEPDAQHPDQWA